MNQSDESIVFGGKLTFSVIIWFDILNQSITFSKLIHFCYEIDLIVRFWPKIYSKIPNDDQLIN